jgi:hypothetical protein
VGYVVVRINWRYNDNWYRAEEEGGDLPATFTVFRDRERAEEECVVLNEMALDYCDIDGDEQVFDSIERRARQADPFRPLPRYDYDKRIHGVGLQTKYDAVFWEVVEVELEEP